MIKEISAGQIKRIYMLARERGLDNEILHELVESVTKKRSIRKLTSEEATKIIVRLGGRKRHNTKQDKYILGLANEIGWGDNQKRLIGFIKKYYKKESMYVLTKREKTNLIIALEKLKSI